MEMVDLTKIKFKELINKSSFYLYGAIGCGAVFVEMILFNTLSIFYKRECKMKTKTHIYMHTQMNQANKTYQLTCKLFQYDCVVLTINFQIDCMKQLKCTYIHLNLLHYIIYITSPIARTMNCRNYYQCTYTDKSLINNSKTIVCVE